LLSLRCPQDRIRPGTSLTTTRLFIMNPTIGLAARTNPGLRCPASGPHAEADAKFSPEKNDFYFERFAPVPSALAAKRLGRHQ
jgi:hypothetical protein